MGWGWRLWIGLLVDGDGDGMAALVVVASYLCFDGCCCCARQGPQGWCSCVSLGSFVRQQVGMRVMYKCGATACCSCAALQVRSKMPLPWYVQWGEGCTRCVRGCAARLSCVAAARRASAQPAAVVFCSSLWVPGTISLAVRAWRDTAVAVWPETWLWCLPVWWVM
mgnify:CR=1 FL=1